MKILFVTGKLAEKALRETLEGMRPDFEYQVAVLKITVAALMTTDFIRRSLKPPPCDLILISGLCQAEPGVLTETFGTKVEKGPKDLRDLPYYFGFEKKREGYGDYRLKILAEINDAPLLPPEEILRKAKYYRASGADIIDIGCTPGRTAENVAEIVKTLKSEGFSLSIDTFNVKEILAADRAGVDYVLSLNSQNLDVAKDLSSTPVVIPDFGKGLESLYKNIEALEKKGVRRYIIDPILDPITFGFAESLYRFYEARRRYPEAEMLMGIGNVTELTDADSTGINALLSGLMEELGVRYVLTTEVAPWTRGAVKELDRARRLMHYAKKRGVLPKDIDDSLLTVKDRKVDCPSEGELLRMQRMITDKNFRIFVDQQWIYVFNSDLFIKDTDIHRIFSKLKDHLGHEPIGHAFYLGRELQKAKIALQLGKKYIQEEELQWGYLSDGLPGD